MKIVIIGAPFTGKSTLARELATQEPVKICSTDSIVYRLKMRCILSEETFEKEVARSIDSSKNWIVEGRHFSKTAVTAADKVMWLNPPLRIVIARKVRQSGINMETLLWLIDQLRDQYMGGLNVCRLGDPLYSHNKKYL